MVRDVRERGRDIEGCIKQWFSFVKPNFHRHVEPQRHSADIIVPRGIENRVAIGLVVDHVRKTLAQKSHLHQIELKRLGRKAEEAPLSKNVVMLEEGPQLRGVCTIVLDPETNREDFIFYFDRVVGALVEKASESATFIPKQVKTPQGHVYEGLQPYGKLPPSCRQVTADTPTSDVCELMVWKALITHRHHLRSNTPPRRHTLRTSSPQSSSKLPSRPPPHPNIPGNGRARTPLPQPPGRHRQPQPRARAGPTDELWRRGTDGCAGVGGSWCERGEDRVCYVVCGKERVG